MYERMIALRNRFFSEVKGGHELELGSGGGFFKEINPECITSDISLVNGVDMVVDAQQLPFDNESVDCIYLVHVLHHIPDVRKFLNEVLRCCKTGGGCVIVEPYWSPAGKFFFKHLHPEPYDDKAKEWSFVSTGAMSGANQALSYILLKRDRKRFNSEYPNLHVEYDRPFNGLSYIATGGLWLKPFLPNLMILFIHKMEKMFSWTMYLFGIHHVFVIKKMN